MLYWASTFNFHTVCWGAVGCGWGTTSVYFGITYVCFIPTVRLVFAVGLQHQHRFFYFCKKNTFIMTQAKFSKTLCRTNIDKVGNVPHSTFSSVALWCPLDSNLNKHAEGHSITNEACTSLAGDHSVTTEVCTTLVRVWVIWRFGSSLELYAWFTTKWLH